jgi:hypothetical protein
MQRRRLDRRTEPAGAYALPVAFGVLSCSLLLPGQGLSARGRIYYITQANDLICAAIVLGVAYRGELRLCSHASASQAREIVANNQKALLIYREMTMMCDLSRTLGTQNKDICLLIEGTLSYPTTHRESIAPPYAMQSPQDATQPFNAPRRSVPCWPLPPGRRKLRLDGRKTNPAAVAPRNDPPGSIGAKLVERDVARRAVSSTVSYPTRSLRDISEGETATDGHFVAVLASPIQRTHLAQPRLHVLRRRGHGSQAPAGGR